MKKKTTIEQLAVIVQKGFKESDARTDKKIDDLAQMVQRGFEQTATKDDLKTLRDELHETREILARAIKDLETHLTTSLSHKQEQIDHLKAWMESVEARVSALESKRPNKNK